MNKDWRSMSFAGGRLTLSGLRMSVKSSQKLVTEGMLTPIWQRMVDEAVIVGEVDIPPRLYNRMPELFQGHEWRPPAWPYALTPREEIESAISAVEHNFRTKQSVIAEYGDWIDSVFPQRKIERDLERELGIVPETAQIEAQTAAQAVVEAENGEQEQELEAAA
jgi:capsid protein